MCPAINAIDNGVGGSIEFVVEASRNQTVPGSADRLLRYQGRTLTYASLAVLCLQRAVNALDDVMALTDRLEGRFRSLLQPPLGWTYWFGEAEALQLSHSADHGGPCIGVYHVIAGSSTIDNAVVPESFR